MLWGGYDAEYQEVARFLGKHDGETSLFSCRGYADGDLVLSADSLRH